MRRDPNKPQNCNANSADPATKSAANAAATLPSACCAFTAAAHLGLSLNHSEVEQLRPQLLCAALHQYTGALQRIKQALQFNTHTAGTETNIRMRMSAVRGRKVLGQAHKHKAHRLMLAALFSWQQTDKLDSDCLHSAAAAD
jgi:hypothetical protein